MIIELNQIFKATTNCDESVERDDQGNLLYRFATSNQQINGSSANIARPMFWFKDISLRDEHEVCPAFFCHSNPFQKKEEVNPWRDVILQDQGVVFYNGDNKTPGVAPNFTPQGSPLTGNTKLESLVNLYFSHSVNDRQKAPPILVFEQEKVNGQIKGFRRFVGLGIISNWDIRQQYTEQGQVFSNYLFEITLISLENGAFDYEWINDRRNSNLSIEEINRKAPKKWIKWIREGNACINSVRQVILKSSTASPSKQIGELKVEHHKILKEIIHHYENRSKKDKFEALASLAATEFFGRRYTEGWITQSTGDMGVDFVGRYDIEHNEIPSLPGNILGRTSLLVVGQAKCRTAYNDVKNGELTRDIARVASRLTRGTIGIYVTTGTYKDSTQAEVSMDELPIILINGRLLADLILSYLIKTGKTLKDVLEERDEWYDNSQRNIPIENILHKDIFF
jgi:hypothetical protein